MRRFVLFLLLLGLLCLGNADAFWQSRDSNYDANVVSGVTPVAFDAKAVTATYGASVSTITNTTLTVGSGAASNGALVATFITSNSTPTITCHWDSTGTNQLMTGLITSSSGIGGQGGIIILGLLLPTAGNKTLSCTPGGSYGDQHLSAVSFTNVNQTNIATAFPHTAGATGTSISPAVTVTSAANNMTVDAMGSNDVIVSSAKTNLFQTNSGNVRGGSSYAAGAASVVFGWTLNSSAVWTDAAVDIAHQ